MRKLFVVVIGVVVLLMAAPFFVGLQVQNMLTQQVEGFYKNPLVAIKVVEYKRGWLESEAVVKFGLSDAYIDLIKKQGQNLDPQVMAWMDSFIEEDLKIYHGPLIFNDGVQLAVSDVHGRIELEEGSSLFEHTRTKEVFTLKAKTGFTGVTEMVGSMPVMDSDTFHFKGLSLTGNIRFADQSGDFAFTMPGLEFAEDERSANVGLVVGDGDFRYLNQLIVIGNGGVSVADVTIKEIGEATFDASNLGFKYDTHLQGNDLVGFDVVYSFDTVKTPDVQVDNFHLGLSLDQFSVKALEMYMELYSSLFAADQSDPNTQPEMLRRAGDIVYALAERSPSMSIDDLHFDYLGGTVQANANVTVDGDKLPDKDAFNLMDIAMWQQLVEANSKLSVPEAVALQIAEQTMRAQLGPLQAENPDMTEADIDQMVNIQVPGMLAGLVLQGMLIKDENGYHSEMEYKEGVLRVNGVPML